MKKGYTLTELLAVIAIIALIFVLVFVNIVKKSNEFKSQSSEKVKETIEASAKSYFYNNNNLKQDAKINKFLVISYNDLKDNGYLSDRIMDVESYNQIDMQNSCVCVRYNTSTYEYTFEAQEPCSCNANSN